jgi:hypothetical protein
MVYAMFMTEWAASKSQILGIRLAVLMMAQAC